MIDQRMVLWTMVGMGMVTYLPRVLPLWLFTSRDLPPLVVAWLRYVPVAVLAAMLLPSLVMPAGQVDLSSTNLFVWVAVPTFVVAWKTRSLFVSVIVGMALVAGLRAIFTI
jgi:branched-subunit amino acid transport protein